MSTTPPNQSHNIRLRIVYGEPLHQLDNLSLTLPLWRIHSLPKAKSALASDPSISQYLRDTYGLDVREDGRYLIYIFDDSDHHQQRGSDGGRRRQRKYRHANELAGVDMASCIEVWLAICLDRVVSKLRSVAAGKEDAWKKLRIYDGLFGEMRRELADKGGVSGVLERDPLGRVVRGEVHEFDEEGDII